MSMAPIQARKAKRTGRVVQHPEGTLHEVVCVECEIPQFHKQGIARCVICNARFSIVAMDIVRTEPPVEIPEKETKHNEEGKGETGV